MGTRRRLVLLVLTPLAACRAIDHDLIVRGGTIYDGSGGAPFVADLAVDGDRITVVGDLTGKRARKELDAGGLAVAPGFVNVLSWATESLLVDGRALSDVVQGVTLEVFGEGWSMGPLNRRMRAALREEQSDITYDVAWRTLGGYLEHLERRGVAPNVASFVGATTLRIHEVGYEDRAPTPEELERMCVLARRAMEEGALGVGSALIYAPAFYAETDELIALARAVAPYGGRYVTHMRSEGNRLFEAVEEVIAIARAANAPAEIYHLKAAGEGNWDKLERVIARIEQVRAEGLDLTADMYTYVAGATGLDAAMPPWVQEGGYDAWAGRLRDPELRRRVIEEMQRPTDEWENFFVAARPEGMLLVEFRNPKLREYVGKTLDEVAALRGTTPAETALDLVVEDGSRVGTVYFLMSEENVERQIALPWVSFGSDAAAPAPEGVFLAANPHPRAYGNFARLLARYVRERRVIPLEEAVRKLTSLPARTLKLRGRGSLLEGYFADVVVFEPATVQDHATFAEPHRLATGVRHVLVNGVPVLEDGRHTRATPGRVVRGPGWIGWRD